MDSTSGFLGGTLGRVNQMVNSGRGNRKIMCYVILGVIIFAFILYSGMLAHYTKTYVLTKVVTSLKIPFYAMLHIVYITYVRLSTVEIFLCRAYLKYLRDLQDFFILKSQQGTIRKFD